MKGKGGYQGDFSRKRLDERERRVSGGLQRIEIR
jgi:hypothetical protein